MIILVLMNQRQMDNTIDGSERQIFILEGGIGIFGFAVLNTFLIGFSVFVSKDFRFSVLVFNALCGFFVF